MQKPLFLVLALALVPGCNTDPRVASSVAQVERVRAGVAVARAAGGDGVAELRRVAADESVRTDAQGRAVLSLDGGARFVLDHNTTVRVTGPRSAVLESGRLWIAGGGEGGAAEEATLASGSATLHLRGARASVEKKDDGADVNVLAGEVAFEAGTRRGAARTGEFAEVRAGNVRLVPQSLFEDWTGGLADDLPSGGGDAAGLGAVAARKPDETGAPRWPMVMQRMDAHVVVRGDLAITTLDQTFFNPSGDTVEGIYTFNTPPGAVLQMFGVDRHGQIVEGRVQERQQAAQQYQQQVYAGSTHDPALLEWDAPGRYHAKLYPIAPGSTRRVRVRFTQWLNADGLGRRAYRLPLAALETRIGEFRADFDLDEAQVASVRTGMEARVKDGHLYVAQSDVLPRADLVVEMNGPAPPDVSVIKVPQVLDGTSDRRGGFVRLAVRAPMPEAREPRDEGVDLVLVVDHSAATDGLGLRLEQAFVESVVNALDPRDRVLVLAGDVQTRALGFQNAELRPATPENRRAIIDALASDGLGGATDLGAMIAAAHHALRPDHNGAVVYIGDGNATVGEANLPALRQAMNRLSPHPRFYAVAVGEAPQLDLLTGLAEPAGFAARVARRGDVARTALDLVRHASRPLVRNFRVELGPEIQQYYPAEPVDLPAGEPLVVIGRYTGALPQDIGVRAMWDGNEVTRRFPVYAQQINDEQDLQYRWASARLGNLLARGESRAVIVELGTRFHLITPYTSLYVPSEDEVGELERAAQAQQALAMRESASQWGISDFFPLVGCSRSMNEAPAASAAAPTEVQARASDQEGGSGTRHAGEEGRMGARDAPSANARYAIRNNGEPPHLSRQAATEATANRGIFAALPGTGAATADNAPAAQAAAAAAPAPVAAAPPPEAPAAVDRLAPAQPYGGVAQDESAARRPMRAHHAAPGGSPGGDDADGNAAGDAFGFGGLGATGTGMGGGGTGEGTIGLGSVGTMGHGAGTGSGQGYGSGAGRGLRERASGGPIVRPAPPTVSGLLSPEAIRRVVLRNLGQVAHCHEQGLAQNPQLAGRVVVRFVIGGTGTVLGSTVASSSLAVPTVGTCIANAVRRWQFPSPEGGSVVTVNYPFNLQAPDEGGNATGVTSPPSATVVYGRPDRDPDERRPSRCSDAAAVPLSQRVDLWRERLAGAYGADSAVNVYRNARRACELPGWADRVTLLRLMLGSVGGIDGQIGLYNALPEGAARDWVRGQVLRQLARTGDLARAAVLGVNRADLAEMTTALGRATTPADRVRVLKEWARRFPDDLDLALRLLDAAVDAHDVAVVRDQSNRLRVHPQADARVRTAVGEALLAVGDEAEARRAFSEIVEFAPDDPLARRRMGDIALSHGWAEEAYRQFQMLAQSENDEPDVLLRQAMAARMAGRLDEAIRLAERVAEQSSPDAGGGVPETAAAWTGTELALAAAAPGASAESLAALRARWRRSPAARASGAVRVVLRWYHPDDGAELWLTQQGDPQRRADMVSDQVFFESTTLMDAPASLSLEVRRGATARAHAKAELIVIWHEGEAGERVDRVPLELDDAHPRFVFNASPGALQDVTPPPVPTPIAAAVATAATPGGAR